jgi:hypothetical protein
MMNTEFRQLWRFDLVAPDGTHEMLEVTAISEADARTRVEAARPSHVIYAIMRRPKVA